MRIIKVLILALAMGGTAQAQVDWLQRNDQHFNSSMEVFAFVKAGGNVDAKLDAVVACRPMAVGTSCPITGTLYRDNDLIPLDSKGFDRRVRVSDSWTHPLNGTHKATTEATQKTVLDQWRIRSSGSISMNYRTSGAVQRHHGLAWSAGKIHFTVRGSPNDRSQRLYFVASGAFSKPTAKTPLTRGWFMFHPKTSGGTNSHWSVNLDPNRTSTEIRQYGVLMPGLYTLDFGISDEPDLSNRAPIDNAYEFEITFGRCEAADSRLTHGTASPASRSVDEAAQRALAEAWTRTLAGQPLVLPIKGRDREWGGMIYETGPGTGEFRYTRPFQGSEGEILASDLTTSFERVAALGLCEGRNFQLVGAYHTHPELPSLLLRYPFDEVGSHLSVGDIDFAIGKGHETGRPFAIYARGHNGDNCGIHKYKTVPGHLHVGVPANATEEEKVDVQEKDRRRDSAVWIPLQPLELKPAKSCTRDGMP